jgi:hypothetical protein
MLFDQPTKIEKEDYTYFVPSPWVFAYHKILISKYRKKEDKREKDILQAIAILREVFKKPDVSRRALSYLETLPTKWSKYIRSKIMEHLPKVSLSIN